ncbi:MAG: hypothetical protein L0Y72_20115 [Gemmataceae bacterium]|nr:hypothetical protein [Gemmataceae bacterium]MCI0741343.1 hypothetical protein [Gemmataceae bacterium]
MSGKVASNRLSRIKTRWTTFVKAHHCAGDEAVAALQRLVLCYYQPVYYYLRSMVRNADIAEELTHEFCVRFLRGDFRQAHPARGRFRDLVKAAVRNLALDYWKRQQLRKKKGPQPFPAEFFFDEDEDLNQEANRRGSPQHFGKPPIDSVFVREWRQCLLLQAWKALARLQKQTGSLYFSVLRFKTTHPQTRSARLAQRLSVRLGRVVTATGVRQLLRRARQRFADCLVAVVARSLLSAGPDEIERELIDLNLFAYCQDALQRLGNPR